MLSQWFSYSVWFGDMQIAGKFTKDTSVHLDAS